MLGYCLAQICISRMKQRKNTIMQSDMQTITIQNVYSSISNYDEELKERLSVFYPKYWFSKKYKEGLWDGKYCFLKGCRRFPTGLLFIVEEYFQEKGIEYQIADRRTFPEIRLMSLDFLAKEPLKGIQLRKYQIDAIIEAVMGGRGVIELPTGSGKTEIAIGITKLLGLNTLFLVNTKDLLHQTADRYEKRIGKKAGIIGDDIFDIKDITISTIQSLYSLFKKNQNRGKEVLNLFDISIYDECHHSSSASFYTLGMYMHNSYFRFGMSATPLKRDILNNMKIMALTGPPIYSLKSKELIDQGFLSNIEVEVVDNPGIVLGKTWQQIYENGIIRSLDRNQKIASIAHDEWQKGKKVMILVRWIEHGEILQRMLVNQLHIPAIFICGKNESWEREKAKQEFNVDGNFVLIVSGIYDEGIDLPEIETLIIGAGGKSELKTIQRVGRGLRKKKNNARLLVYDFMDSAKYLRAHSKNRLKTYEKEGFLKEK